MKAGERARRERFPNSAFALELPAPLWNSRKVPDPASVFHS